MIVGIIIGFVAGFVLAFGIFHNNKAKADALVTTVEAEAKKV
jgi:hypothetical protein